MNGLEKILGAISSEAEAEAAKKLDSAKEAARAVEEEATLRAEAEQEKILSAADAEVKNILERAKSAAALNERQVLLNAKQQLIGEVIAGALEKMRRLPREEYFNVILRLAGLHAANEEGFICFSAADKERLPDDFAAALNAALKDAGKAKASLTVSENTADIDGGFILTYGDIEENCSFEALFAEQADELLDAANKVLFAE